MAADAMISSLPGARAHILKVGVVMLVGWGALAGIAEANAPCSGRKGGIASCRGETFICNDGSVSGSKKSCTAYMDVVGLVGSDDDMAPTTDGSCECRSGSYCTGPRGGRYCIGDNGRKSYLK